MPGYRPPSTEPRGKWAKRIHEKRRAEGLSQTGAFELLRERLGFGPKSRFSYTALDMGTREPNDHEAAVLAEWLGGYPDEIMSSPDNGSTSVSGLGALNDQLAEQNRLIGQLIEQNASLMALVVPPPDGPLRDRARADVAAFDDAAGQPRTTRQLRRPGHDRRGEGGTRRSREGEAS